LFARKSNNEYAQKRAQDKSARFVQLFLHAMRQTNSNSHLLSAMLKTPRQLNPLSSVMNARTSTPDSVSTGAVPFGHFTLGQFMVCDPPLVSSKMNPLAFDEDWPLNVNVTVPVTVAVTKFPEFKSMVVDPEMFPRAFIDREYPFIAAFKEDPSKVSPSFPVSEFVESLYNTWLADPATGTLIPSMASQATPFQIQVLDPNE